MLLENNDDVGDWSHLWHGHNYDLTMVSAGGDTMQGMTRTELISMQKRL